MSCLPEEVRLHSLATNERSVNLKYRFLLKLLETFRIMSLHTFRLHNLMLNSLCLKVTWLTSLHFSPLDVELLYNQSTPTQKGLPVLLHLYFFFCTGFNLCLFFLICPSLKSMGHFNHAFDYHDSITSMYVGGNMPSANCSISKCKHNTS